MPDPAAPLRRGSFTPLPRTFDEAAGRSPQHLAVRDAALAWSYRELAERSDRLAHWLLARGIGAGSVVAIHAARVAATPWAMLATLKAGAALTILDAAYPDARLVEQLRLARPAAWLSALADAGAAAAADTGMLAEQRALIPHRLDLADAEQALAALPSTSPRVEIAPDSPAYLIFTSGTTSQPKSIAIDHAGLAHFIAWQAATFGFGADDRFSGLSGLAHAPFIRDVLAPLAIGGSLHLPPPQYRREADALRRWFLAERITICHLTPSLGALLSEVTEPAEPLALRWAFFSGEPLQGRHVRALAELAPAASVVNFYAASETPQAVAFHLVDERTEGPVPVGAGIDCAQLLVLDDAGQPTAPGQGGEVWVRSPYLPAAYADGRSGGYRVNPFTGDPADRIWRSGDLGRRRPDGRVEIVGRLDEQIKVRGFRVEPAEIEATLRQLGLATQSAVVAGPGGALVAYVCATAGAAEMRAALAERLPDYMVPTEFVHVDSLPLTPNGKLDRGALASRRRLRPRRTGEPAVAAGRNAWAIEMIEQTVTAIWRDVLDAEVVGRTDNFFDLGGHSLNATRIVTRLWEETGAKIDLRSVFEAPTVAEVARLLERILSEPKPAGSAARNSPRA